MVKVSYVLDESVIKASKEELKSVANKELTGCDDLLQTSYLEGDITCELTVDEKQVRYTIAGSEGVFKDVFLPLNKSMRFYNGEKYAYLCSLEKKIICTIKKDSYVEGSQEEILSLLGAKAGAQTESEIKAQKELENTLLRAQQRKNAEQFFGSKETKGNLPKNKTQLKDRFQTQKYFAVAFALFGMIGSMDGLLFGGGVSPVTILRNGLIGLITGFFFSFTYTFFRAWFDNQKENVRVGSLVLFFVTFPAFTLMGVLGAIPYSVYQLVDGKRTRGVTKVINIAVPIFMGLVLFAELGLLYLIFGYGMFS